MINFNRENNIFNYRAVAIIIKDDKICHEISTYFLMKIINKNDLKP
jgi:hypothetical protein